MKSLTPILNMICPTENCNTEITHEFNRLRGATFSLAQKHYHQLRTKVEGVKPALIKIKDLKALKKYDAGNVFENFDIKCNKCKCRHFFKMSTLTGDVTKA